MMSHVLPTAVRQAVSRPQFELPQRDEGWMESNDPIGSSEFIRTSRPPVFVVSTEKLRKNIKRVNIDVMSCIIVSVRVNPQYCELNRELTDTITLLLVRSVVPNRDSIKDTELWDYIFSWQEGQTTSTKDDKDVKWELSIIITSTEQNMMMRSSGINWVFIKAYLCLSLSRISSVWTSALKSGGEWPKASNRFMAACEPVSSSSICMSKLESTPSTCRLLIMPRHLLVFVSSSWHTIAPLNTEHRQHTYI